MGSVDVSGNNAHIVSGNDFGVVSGNVLWQCFRKQEGYREMPQAPSANMRVNQLRERYREAGLSRVEVLVPKDQAQAVKAYAAQLREGSQSERLKEVRKLLARAYRRYRASCLDNIGIRPEKASFGDAAVVAAALMHRGNAEAYKLGRKIGRLAS